MDAIYESLVSGWLPLRPVRMLLKTDLFDEAVGEGVYPSLNVRARHVVGTDLSIGTIRHAQTHHLGLLAAAGDVRRLPFAGESFDVVLSTSTLDHFQSREDIAVSLAEIFRVLRPGGELLVTLDNLANPTVAVRNALPFGLLRGLGLVPYFVGATLGPRGLRRALGEAGFEVARLGAALHCPRVPSVWLASLLSRRGSLVVQTRFLGALRSFEVLGRLPTRHLTGHFLVARAVKPGSSRTPRGGAA
jgi:SAM-dependent methyltransferase